MDNEQELAAVRVGATTLGDMLLKAWDRVPHGEALIFPEERRSYDALVRYVLLRARGLLALGVRSGDHVGILMPSGAGFVEVLFANAMIGAVSVLLNMRFKAPELQYIARDADLTTIITTDAQAEHVDVVTRLQEALPGLAQASNPHALALDAAPRLRRVIMLGQTEAPGILGESALYAAATQVNDTAVHRTRICVRVRAPAMILYTSGTSANPKGCLLSHEAITREAASLADYRWRFTPDERCWSPMPLFHVAAMLGMLGAVHVGGTFIGQPHFDPGESLRQIEAERVTMMFLPFVTFHQAMIAHPDWAKTDFSSVRLQNSCFAFMPEAVERAYREKAPDMLQIGTFGLTEGTGIVTTGGYDMDPALGIQRLGYPLAGVEVRIVDLENGADLPIGERGQILFRGYNVFDGYHNDPEKTAAAIDADGWCHTGDIGSLDANGHLMFHGRFRDMLKVGGENVAAAEVEAVLASHPAVRLAQVVGLPDLRLAEIPAAFVEREGSSDIDPKELISYANERLASFKVPRHIRFVDEWPMSASKIQKFKLRNQLMSELGLSD